MSPAHVAAAANIALHDLAVFDQTGSAEDLTSFTADRDAIAAVVAGWLGFEAAEMQAAWAAADTTHQEAVLAALSQLGVPYRRNTSKQDIGFDCSGLTFFAWGKAGVTLARSSGAQIRGGAPRTQETAQAGDLVYYPGHVMMYLGVGDAMVHSPYSGRTVEVDHISQRRINSVRYADPSS